METHEEADALGRRVDDAVDDRLDQPSVQQRPLLGSVERRRAKMGETLQQKGRQLVALLTGVGEHVEASAAVPPHLATGRLAQRLPMAVFERKVPIQRRLRNQTARDGVDRRWVVVMSEAGHDGEHERANERNPRRPP